MNGISSELWNMLYSIAFGGVIGVFYDGLRFIRKLTLGNFAVTLILDIVFPTFSAAGVFLFALVVWNGSIRLLYIVFMAVGFTVYYCSFGMITIKLFNFTVCPVAFVCGKIKKLMGKSRKNNKKLTVGAKKIPFCSSILHKKNIK